MNDRTAGIPRSWRLLEALQRRQRDYTVLALAIVNTAVLVYDVTALAGGLSGWG